jgi:hypothetical protein
MTLETLTVIAQCVALLLNTTNLVVLTLIVWRLR